MQKNRLLILLVLSLTTLLMLSAAGLAQQAPATGSDQVQGEKEGRRGPRGHHREGRREGRMLERLTQVLNLTEDQQAQIKRLFEAEATQLKALRQDATLSQEEKLAKARALREATQDELRKVLTPEQVQKLGELRGKGRRRP